MKRLLIATASLSALIMAGACHKTGSNADQDASKPSDSAPVNTVQDVTATAVGAVAAPTAAMTTDGYVTNAAIADMYEIEAGKIAQQRSKRADVKALAGMIIKDHTAMSAMMKKALPTAGVTTAPPTALDDRRTGMINNLKAAGDFDFDGAYLHQQLAAHIEALELHKTFEAKTDNAALKAVASSAVPKIQAHLSEVRKVGGDLLKDVAPGDNGSGGGSASSGSGGSAPAQK